jgi:hypothetical protein
MTDIPTLALSVRQPWAWAIIHGGKPVENRSQGAIKHIKPRIWTMERGYQRIAIHASLGMTQDEHWQAFQFMSSISVTCPQAKDLIRGAIIGHVQVECVISDSASPWYFGPRALLLSDPQAIDPIPAAGQLGAFAWKPREGVIDPPKKWMLNTACASVPLGAPISELLL